MAGRTSMPLRFGEPRACLKLVIARGAAKKMSRSQPNEKAEPEDQGCASKPPECAMELRDWNADSKQQEEAQNHTCVVSAKAAEVVSGDLGRRDPRCGFVILVRRVPRASAAACEYVVHLARKSSGAAGGNERGLQRLCFHDLDRGRRAARGCLQRRVRASHGIRDQCHQ